MCRARGFPRHGGAWHGGPSPSLFLRRDPRRKAGEGSALCSPGARHLHLPGAGAPPAAAAGPLAGPTALAHVAAGANNGMALGLPRSPRKAFLLLLLLLAAGSACPSQEQGGGGLKR